MQTFIDNKKKKRIFDIIQIGQRDDFISRAFDLFIVAVILVNIAILFMETFEQFDNPAFLLSVRICCIQNVTGSQDLPPVQDQCLLRFFSCYHIRFIRKEEPDHLINLHYSGADDGFLSVHVQCGA